jgi:hypothetical protein
MAASSLSPMAAAAPVIQCGYSDGAGLSRLHLSLPSPAPGLRMATLKGRVGVSVGAPGLDFAVFDLTRPGRQSFELDGLVLSVLSIARDGVHYVVAGELSVPANSPLACAMADLGPSRIAGRITKRHSPKSTCRIRSHRQRPDHDEVDSDNNGSNGVRSHGPDEFVSDAMRSRGPHMVHAAGASMVRRAV